MKVTLRHIVDTDTFVSDEAIYDTDNYIYLRHFGYVSVSDMEVVWHTETDQPPVKIRLKSGREVYGSRANATSTYYLTDIGRINIGEIDRIYPMPAKPMVSEILRQRMKATKEEA